MALTIVNVTSISPDRKAEIVGYLKEKFEATVKARSTQIDQNYQRWIDNYAAKPLEQVRTTPFYRASNFVPRLIGTLTDILSARLTGIIWAPKPFWKPRTLLGQLPHEYLEELTNWMEYKTNFELELFNVLDLGIFRVCKTGTLVLKGPFEQRIIQLVTGITATGIEEKTDTSEGICLSDIPHDDFWVYPITARSLKQATIKYHRIRLTREEVQLRINRGWWDKAAAELLLQGGPSEASNVDQAKAKDAGITLTVDVTRPYNAVEAWFEYELEPGKIYRLVCVFAPHLPKDKACLRLYYQYYKNATIDPFIDARIIPKEDSFYGTSMPEILEQAQEEQAQIHNARRDANSIMNVPGWKKKRYADVPNPSTEWYPGKVFELENMDDLEPLQFSSQYIDTTAEESFLLQLSERYSGVGSPAQAAGQGMLEGKRGIYNTGGTLGLLAEGNRRLDIYIRRLRQPFHNLGNLIYQSYRDFAPNGAEYSMLGKTGEYVTKTFKFAEPAGTRGLFFEIGASDGGANRETDRQSLLLMANTMAAYYRQVTEAGAMLAQLPPDHPMAAILLSVLDGAKDLANRLLFAFDVGDRNRIVPDIRALLAGGSQQANAEAERVGLPPTEESLSVTGLQSLSRNIDAVTSAARQGVNGVPRS